MGTQLRCYALTRAPQLRWRVTRKVAHDPSFRVIALASTVHMGRRMRLLLLTLCLMSFSSCVALFGLGGLAASLAAGDHDRSRRAGAERDARQLAEHASEAAVIRARYNAEEKKSAARESAVLPVPPGRWGELTPSLTAPPLVSLEPPRIPLRARGTPQP